MNIVKYPDPALTAKCEPVTEFNSELHTTLDQMYAAMIADKGMGLAANQVSILKTFFVMMDLKGKLWDFINPKIIDQDGVQYHQEGCLSFPGVLLQVPRAETVTVQAQNRHGEEFKVMVTGYESVCVQHEMDHLAGITFFDKVSRQQRRAAENVLKARMAKKA